MKSKTIFLIPVFFVITIQNVYADNTFCPRGEYSFIKGANGLNELTAVLTLPTPGYKVNLSVGPEFIYPPFVNFHCTKPSGIVPQVLTKYTQSLRLQFDRIQLIDKEGKQMIIAKSASGAAENEQILKKCNTNEQCGDGEFCDTTPSCPDGKVSGICITKPKLCTQEFLPVNGCDGKSYSNRCAAAAEGQPITGNLKLK